MDTLVPDTKERINRKITHLRNEITNILHFREKWQNWKMKKTP